LTQYRLERYNPDESHNR